MNQNQPFQRARRPMIAAAGLLCVLLTGACGDGGGGAQESASSVRGVSDTEIVLGSHN